MLLSISMGMILLFSLNGNIVSGFLLTEIVTGMIYNYVCIIFFISFQQGDLLIGLDLDYYDSEEELDGDSEIGDFSDSDNEFDSDVTLEELAQGGHDIPKGQGTGKFPQNNVNGVEALNGGSMAVVPAGESGLFFIGD